MSDSSTPSVLRHIENSVRLRQRTFRQVVLGQMMPLARRRTLLGTQMQWLFATDEDPRGMTLVEDSTDRTTEQAETDPDDTDTPSVSPRERVELVADSPPEQHIRAANAVADKHPTARRVVLKGDERITVAQSPGGAFELKVSQVLQREFDIVEHSETTDPAAPSMGELGRAP